MTIHLREVSFSEDDGRGVDYVATEDIPKVGGGRDSGRVMVRLDVDAGVPIVYTDLGTTGDLEAIERSIDTLQLLHERLMALYGDDRGERGRGQCMDFGDWGRCRATYGHDGEHSTPTEHDWEAEMKALGKLTSA